MRFPAYIFSEVPPLLLSTKNPDPKPLFWDGIDIKTTEPTLLFLEHGYSRQDHDWLLDLQDPAREVR